MATSHMITDNVLHLSSWLQKRLLRIHSQEHVHKKFGNYESPVTSKNHSSLIGACEFV